jgi:3-hydroxyisobutyrate dehydrogenase-like beta-hydroxyacid dehydrogenase
MVGATEEDFREVLPLLQAMGTDIVHCGGPGAGIVVKVANNLLAQTIMAANLEALLLGVKGGVAVEPMLRAFQLTAANNVGLRTSIPDQVLKRNFAPGFKLALAHKDQRLGQSFAAQMGMPLFTLASARQLWAIALEQGKGDLATSAVAEVFEQFAGAKLTG